MNKKILCVLLFLSLAMAQIQAFSFGSLFSGERGVFALDGLGDGLLGGGGAALSLTGLLLDKLGTHPNFDGNALPIDSVNKFDRWAMRPYSKALDISGTVTQAVAMATPLFAFAAGATEIGVITVMYAESVLWANGAKEILKSIVQRQRPYMYFSGAPQTEIDNGDFVRSFPSGHTTMAFNGAVFASYVFCQYFPESAWRFPVVIGSVALAVGTAVQRMLSGNHFFSDVLAGAVLGSATGFLIPFAHKKFAERNASVNRNAQNIEVFMCPSGVAMQIKF